MGIRMKHHLGSVMTDLRWEPVPYRVRAWVDEVLVVDSTDAAVVWEPRRLVPVFAVPAADLAGEVAAADPQPGPPDLAALPPMLGPTDFATHTVPGTVVDVGPVGQRRPGAGFVPDDADLAGLVLLDFDAFTAWRTEDQQLVGHAHDPFKRIDVMDSDRLVEVALAGTVLARSRHPRLLWETHLPQRWYLPREDVRMDLLEPSATRSTCAYKGHASYLSVVGGPRDIAWSYPEPLPDAEPVRDLVCFFAERTDLTLDGRAVPRPITPWSTPEEMAQADVSRLEFG